MRVIAIIPARMGSSRFPDKPMAKIRGMPMIGHCYFRTSMCPDLISTYVATCDKEIFDYIDSIGGNAVMTSDSHERATDRTAEAMLKIEESLGQKIDIVVMVQGDEPMVTPAMITDSITAMNEGIQVVNLMAEIKSIEEFEDPNEVKVVVDKFNNALYFSREPIPSRKKSANKIQMLKQVCIIPFERDFLIEFNNMPETELERIESVDMMRILENGGKVKMVMSNCDTYSVDTIDDLERVDNLMEHDKLINNYMVTI